MAFYKPCTIKDAFLDLTLKNRSFNEKKGLSNNLYFKHNSNQVWKSSLVVRILAKKIAFRLDKIIG